MSGKVTLHHLDVSLSLTDFHDISKSLIERSIRNHNVYYGFGKSFSISEQYKVSRHIVTPSTERFVPYSEELRLASASTSTPFEYDLVNHSRVKRRSPPELKDTHPLGKSPQLVLPSGRVLIESATIARYLIEHYDHTNSFKGDTSDPAMDAYRDDMFRLFAGASIPIPMMVDFIFNLVVDQSPFFLRPLFRGAHTMLRKMFSGPEIDAMYKYLNDELEGRDWIMGGPNPACADFCLSWPTDFCVQTGKLDLTRAEFHRVKAWYDRYQSREGYKSALARGNGYNLNV